MPEVTEETELDTLEAEFQKAEDALLKARDAFEKRNTRRTRTDLADASKVYDDAGRAVRRASDPERALDLEEYKRALRKRQKAREDKANRRRG